jgi:hypothetical protein
MNWVIIDTIFGLEEDKLSGSVGFKSLKDYCSSERAKESSPKNFPREICTYFLIN